MDRIILSAQLALFYNGTHNRPDLLYYRMASNIKDFGDVIPNITPFNNSGVPSVYAVSNDSGCSLGISSGRMDLIFNSKEYSIGEEDAFLKNAKLLLESLSVDICRIGIIKAEFYRIDADQYIRDNFIRGAKQYDEINISFNRRSKISGKMYNNIFKYSSASLNIQDTTVNGLVAEYDFNNVSEGKNLSKELMKSLFDKHMEAHIITGD